MFNELVCVKLVECGFVDGGYVFKMEDGICYFVVGDQIVFLKNEGLLGVKNGMLVKVMEVVLGCIVVEVGEGEYC